MAVTKAQLVERAQALVPKIAAAAAGTDLNRAISDEILGELIDAEFMQILVPKRYGGHELDIDTMTSVVRPIAAACPATAWVLAFYIGHAWVHALFPEQAQREAFAQRPFTLSPGTIAPTYRYKRAAGGYVLNGKASWNSGVIHADFIFCPGFIEGEEANGPVLSFVPRTDIRVEDNWFVLGMRGTGSHDLIAEELFVPEHRMVRLPDVLDGTTPGAALSENPLYARPMLPVALTEVTSVIVGAYTGAADEFVRLTKNRLATYTGAKMAQKVPAQMRIGRGLSRAQILNAALDDFIAIVANPDLTAVRNLDLRGALKTRAAMLADMSRDGINDLVRGSGADSLRDGTDMQRYFRDINIVSLHAFFDVDTATETYGRMQLGLEPQTFL